MNDLRIATHRKKSSYSRKYTPSPSRKCAQTVLNLLLNLFLWTRPQSRLLLNLFLWTRPRSRARKHALVLGPEGWDVVEAETLRPLLKPCVSRITSYKNEMLKSVTS